MELVFVFLILIFIYFLFIKKYYIKEKKTFLIQKRDIIRVYSSFLSDIFVDRNDKIIDAKNIENIEHDIIFFMKRIEKIQKTFLFLQKKSDVLEKENFISIEKKWILDFSLDFVKKLDNWLAFHKDELINLLNNLQKQSDKTNIQNFKWNLLLHKQRIEKQLEKINTK